MASERSHRGLFFDRDGTLNEEVGHMTDLDRLRLIDGAEKAVGLARDAGWRTAIITNQGAIARGIADESSVREANRLVAADPVRLEVVYVMKNDRCNEQQAVEAIQQTTMSGNRVTEVFDANVTFDGREHQVTELAQNTNQHA